VDENDHLRDAMSESLKFVPHIKCEGSFDSAASVLSMLKSGLIPDIILMEVKMPRMYGIEATPLVKQLSPMTMVVLMSTYFEPKIKTLALAGGASLFVQKSHPFDQMLATIIQVRASLANRGCSANSPSNNQTPSHQPASTNLGGIARIGDALL
jgi:DNA-binding NarL/FixJ family response regulator